MDSPAQDDAVLRGLEENANRVQDLVGSSADVAAGCNTSAVVVALKHLKAMAIIDGKVLDLPLFPDIRGETMDPGNFGLSTRLVSRKAKSIKLDTHRDAERAASIRARAATDAARRFGVSRGGENGGRRRGERDAGVPQVSQPVHREREADARTEAERLGTSNLVMARETAIQLARQTERDAKQRAAETPVPMEVDGGDGARGGAPTDPSDNGAASGTRLRIAFETPAERDAPRRWRTPRRRRRVPRGVPTARRTVTVTAAAAARIGR